MDIIQAVILLNLKTLILSAIWAGNARVRQLQNFVGEKSNNKVENHFLPVETEPEIKRKHGCGKKRKPRYTI